MSLSDVGNAYEIDQHGKVKTEEEIKKERRLRGLCQLCGETKTHERNAFGIRKQLNVDGLSFRGHCLLCYDVKRIGGRWQVIKRPRRLNRSGNGGGTAMPTAEVRRAATTPMPATTTTSSSSSNGSGNKHTTTTQGLPSSYNFTSQSSIGSTGVGSISSSTASSSTQSHPSIRNSGSKIPGMCFKPKISFHVKSRDCTTSGSNDSIIPSTPTKIISDDKALSKLSKATSLTQITHILNESSKSAIVCNRAFNNAGAVAGAGAGAGAGEGAAQAGGASGKSDGLSRNTAQPQQQQQRRHVFGSINDAAVSSKKSGWRPESLSNGQIETRYRLAFRSGLKTRLELDVALRRLAFEFEYNHSGLSARSCLVAAVVNESGGGGKVVPVVIRSARLEDGSKLVPLPGPRFDAAANAIPPGEHLGYLAYGAIPTPFKKGHVRVQLESNAFSAYLSNTRAELQPKLGFRAHLMESTRTSKWWCKYVIVVEAE